MNNYIILNSKKYSTPAKAWEPIPDKPATFRVTLDGKADVTYGPATISEYRGEVEAPVQSDTGWGNVTDLRAVVATLGSVSFTDHFGNSFLAHILGPNGERYLTPMWDASENKVRIAVRLIIESAV